MAICFYHSPCSDGIVSVGLVSKYIKDIELVGVKAGCKELTADDYHDKELLFVDLCPEKGLLLQLLENFCEITIWDHHKSSQVAINEVQHAKLNVVFDMERSGCQITFDCLAGSEETSRPWVVDYVGDRDLWKFQLPNSKMINLGLFEFEYLTLEGLDKLPKGNIDNPEVQKFINEELLPKTQIIDEKHQRMMKYDVWKSLEMEMVVPGHEKKYRVWLGQTYSTLVSEFGHLLYVTPFKDGTMPDFAVVWSYNLKLCQWSCSLRGGKREDLEGDGIDLSEIAAAYGGGGHKAPAGFKISPQDFNYWDIFTPLNES